MKCFGFDVLADQYKHSKPKPTMDQGDKEESGKKQSHLD